MQDLIEELVKKADLTQEQAEKSIDVIRKYILSKIPPMMQPMVDNFLGVAQEDDTSTTDIGA